jgi:hypothetical protein
MVSGRVLFLPSTGCPTLWVEGVRAYKLTDDERFKKLCSTTVAFIPPYGKLREAMIEYFAKDFDDKNTTWLEGKIRSGVCSAVLPTSAH